MAEIGFLASCIMDLSFVVGEFPQAGETRTAKAFHDGFGGKGANQAVAASRSGADVGVIGAVGEDGFGHETRKNFQNNGIDCEYLFEMQDQGTGLATVVVNEAGENQIIVAPRANLALEPDHLNQVESNWFDLDYIGGVLELNEEVLVEAFRRSHQHDVTTVLNAAPAKNITDELWSETDCLIVNETEAGRYAGTRPTVEHYEPILETILGKGPDLVVVTLGDEGAAYLTCEGISGAIKAPDVDSVVDTTGAGDAFVGSFISARGEGLNLEEAISRANRYAAKSVTGEGTQKSFPQRPVV